MKVGMVGDHYPHVEHREEFIARVQRVAEAFRQTPGCLSADCWVTDDGAVVSTVQWESEDAYQASFAAIMESGLDLDYDERESRPREIRQLLEA